MLVHPIVFSALEKSSTFQEAGFVLPFTAVLESGVVTAAYTSNADASAVRHTAAYYQKSVLKKEYDLSATAIVTGLGLEDEFTEFVVERRKSRIDKISTSFFEKIATGNTTQQQQQRHLQHQEQLQRQQQLLARGKKSGSGGQHQQQQQNATDLSSSSSDTSFSINVEFLTPQHSHNLLARGSADRFPHNFSDTSECLLQHLKETKQKIPSHLQGTPSPSVPGSEGGLLHLDDGKKHRSGILQAFVPPQDMMEGGGNTAIHVSWKTSSPTSTFFPPPPASSHHQHHRHNNEGAGGEVGVGNQEEEEEEDSPLPTQGSTKQVTWSMTQRENIYGFRQRKYYPYERCATIEGPRTLSHTKKMSNTEIRNVMRAADYVLKKLSQLQQTLEEVHLVFKFGPHGILYLLNAPLVSYLDTPIRYALCFHTPQQYVKRTPGPPRPRASCIFEEDMIEPLDGRCLDDDVVDVGKRQKGKVSTRPAATSSSTSVNPTGGAGGWTLLESISTNKKKKNSKTSSSSRQQTEGDVLPSSTSSSSDNDDDDEDEDGEGRIAAMMRKRLNERKKKEGLLPPTVEYDSVMQAITGSFPAPLPNHHQRLTHRQRKLQLLSGSVPSPSGKSRSPGLASSSSSNPYVSSSNRKGISKLTKSSSSPTFMTNRESPVPDENALERRRENTIVHNCRSLLAALEGKRPLERSLADEFGLSKKHRVFLKKGLKQMSRSVITTTAADPSVVDLKTDVCEARARPQTTQMTFRSSKNRSTSHQRNDNNNRAGSAMAGGGGENDGDKHEGRHTQSNKHSHKKKKTGGGSSSSSTSSFQPFQVTSTMADGGGGVLVNKERLRAGSEHPSVRGTIRPLQRKTTPTITHAEWSAKMRRRDEIQKEKQKQQILLASEKEKGGHHHHHRHHTSDGDECASASSGTSSVDGDGTGTSSNVTSNNRSASHQRHHRPHRHSRQEWSEHPSGRTSPGGTVSPTSRSFVEYPELANFLLAIPATPANDSVDEGGSVTNPGSPTTTSGGMDSMYASTDNYTAFLTSGGGGGAAVGAETATGTAVERLRDLLNVIDSDCDVYVMLSTGEQQDAWIASVAERRQKGGGGSGVVVDGGKLLLAQNGPNGGGEARLRHSHPQQGSGGASKLLNQTVERSATSPGKMSSTGTKTTTTTCGTTEKPSLETRVMFMLEYVTSWWRYSCQHHRPSVDTRSSSTAAANNEEEIEKKLQGLRVAAQSAVEYLTELDYHISNYYMSKPSSAFVKKGFGDNGGGSSGSHHATKGPVGIGGAGGGEMLLFSVQPLLLGSLERRLVSFLRSIPYFEQMNTEDNVAELQYLLANNNNNNTPCDGGTANSNNARAGGGGGGGEKRDGGSAAHLSANLVHFDDPLFDAHLSKRTNIALTATFCLTGHPPKFELQSRFNHWVLDTLRLIVLEKLDEIVDISSSLL